MSSNNNGEYIGLFKTYYKVQGIKLEITIAKTPQMSGVAEKMN